MFKKDFIINIANRLSEQQQFHQQNYNQQQVFNQKHLQEDYNTVQTNIRSIERLKSIEDEIEKDYSKYVNEYGLTKTAFAKAVNQIREKQLKIQNPTSSGTLQQQSQPVSTRQTRLSMHSNEKKRVGSNNPRSNSTSQQRKGSTHRQQNNHQKKIQIQGANGAGQETVNDLYMNTNLVRADSSKQIRSVRAKHLSSNNSSSCFQRSSKLSPEKNNIITNQFQGQNGAFNQTAASNFTSTQLNQTPSSNYITLKAQVPAFKQTKGIKIKFPLGGNGIVSQKENVQSQSNANNQQDTSQNQTPKRIKLQKTKSTSSIPIQFSQRGAIQQPASTILSNSRGRQGGIPEMVIMDELSQQMSANNGLISSNMRSSQTQNFIDMGQNPNGQMLQSMLFPQGTFQSNSCLGTFATTSILNSPLSFKNQAYQPVLNHQRQSCKGRQSSRNGATSQHQSQKSIGRNHQRASSSNNLLQASNNKIKSKGEQKRMSAGSNITKKVLQHNAHHQTSSGNIQQHILQLLMSYQNQETGGDLTSTLNFQQYLPFQNTQKSLNFNLNNTQSMKDLKSFKQQQVQPSTLMKDLQIIKAPKQKITTLASQSNNTQSQHTINTQRQGQTGSILMLNQNFKKSERSGKNTSRGDGKKRIVQQQNVINPYQPNEVSTYTQMQQTNNELSSRIQSVLNGDSNATMGMQSQIDHAKKILSNSKSQDNLDLIKFAAQRAALESQQQQQMLSSQYQQTQLPAAKFLQNLKPSENTISFSKIKLVPSSNQALLSARNIQQHPHTYDPNVFRSANSEYQSHPLQHQQKHQQQILSGISILSSKLGGGSGGLTNIIIGHNFDKPQSRRASTKFNPSSTRSQQQQ